MTPTSYTWKVNGVTKAYGGTSFTLNSSTVGNNTVSCTVTYGSASYTASSSPINLTNTFYYCYEENGPDERAAGRPENFTMQYTGTLYIDLKQNDTNEEGTLTVKKNGTAIASTTLKDAAYSLIKTVTVNKGDTISFQYTITGRARRLCKLGGHTYIYQTIGP